METRVIILAARAQKETISQELEKLKNRVINLVVLVGNVFNSLGHNSFCNRQIVEVG